MGSFMRVHINPPMHNTVSRLPSHDDSDEPQSCSENGSHATLVELAARRSSPGLSVPSGSVENDFRATLRALGMHSALGLLNARTRFRFTGVYRADPPLLRNEYLFDRENPSLSLGGNVNPLDHTYCGIVAATRQPFAAEDAQHDARLTVHPARDSVVSYIGVPIRISNGHVFGTLCHFDTRPRILPLDEVATLESISRIVAQWIEAPPTRSA
jgi:GAF domain-containing protein